MKAAVKKQEKQQPNRCNAMHRSLPEVKGLRVNNAYWRQFDSPVSEAADSAYSGFLQSYDQELGSRSYGAVVDLLVAYYGPSAA